MLEELRVYLLDAFQKNNSGFLLSFKGVNAGGEAGQESVFSA